MGHKVLKSAVVLTGGAALAHGIPAVATIPFVRVKLFSKLSGLGRANHVALTFDDGPDPKSTPVFLDTLDQLGHKATFFMLGLMVERNPSIAREVVSRGHEIGLHGYEHINHLYRTFPGVLADIRKGFDTIVNLTDTTPTWFRPPYGVLSTSSLISAKLTGLKPILWTTWGKDWEDSCTPETIFHNLTKSIDPNSTNSRISNPRMAGPTLLLHDSDCTSQVSSWISSVNSLHLLDKWASENQFDLGTLSDHFP